MTILENILKFKNIYMYISLLNNKISIIDIKIIENC